MTDLRALLIFNPQSGRRRSKQAQLPEILQCLKSLGIDTKPEPTRAPGHATELAREAVARGVELVIAWGGDGTVNEVAQGLIGSNVPLGILPGGTVNVFARETAIPLGFRGACQVLARGKPQTIPLGFASGRPFLLMAGIGLDGAVAQLLNASPRKRLGVLSFWLEGFRLLLSYRFSPFIVRSEGLEYRATSVVAGKLPRYGPRYVITPRAGLHEPFLDVVVFQGSGALDYLRYLMGVLVGVHLRFKDVIHFPASHLQIRSRHSVRYQLDGEPVGELPVDLEVKKDGLRVMLPSP